MTKLASKVVEQAKAWVGLKESDGSHKEIIDVYNSHKPLARGHKMSMTDDWCAATVSAVSIKLGYTDIIPLECSCTKMIELFKKLDSWEERDSVTPEPAWILFYDWEDKKDYSGDNKNRPNHVGIVEKVSGGKITVIEGNYKNGVNRRTLSVNGKYIRGYGVPKYDQEFTSKEACTVELSVLKKGSKGRDVKSMQILLIGHSFSCGSYGADGSFGSATDGSVRAFQKANGLEVDGICGTKTWAKLLGFG